MTVAFYYFDESINKFKDELTQANYHVLRRNRWKKKEIRSI